MDRGWRAWQRHRAHQLTQNHNRHAAISLYGALSLRLLGVYLHGWARWVMRKCARSRLFWNAMRELRGIALRRSLQSWHTLHRHCQYKEQSKLSSAQRRTASIAVILLQQWNSQHRRSAQSRFKEERALQMRRKQQITRLFHQWHQSAQKILSSVQHTRRVTRWIGRPSCGRAGHGMAWHGI